MIHALIRRLLKKQLPFPEEYFRSDKQFNLLYPPYIQQLARKHWTPLEIVKQAATFLANEKGAKILDIGSGAGKFCLAAAYFYPEAQYTGVEQRWNLVAQAEATKERLGLTNVTFLHGNFSLLDFSQFNSFYFYNAFYEHIAPQGHIDDSIPFSKETYEQYNNELFRQLEKMPAGTKLVAYHVLKSEIPESFKITREEADGFLKFCIKM